MSKTDRRWLLLLALYALIGCWTYGYDFARRASEKKEPREVLVVDSFFSAVFWPLYWPARCSLDFWELRIGKAKEAKP